MKKILVIIMLLVSLTAYGQWGTTTHKVRYVHPTSNGFYKAGNSTVFTFNIGDYKFVGPMALADALYKKTNTAKGGEFRYKCDDEEEAMALDGFIRDNKREIEEKYDIIITEVFTFSRAVSITLYDRETYENSELAKQEKERVKLQEREERMSSLTTIL